MAMAHGGGGWKDKLRIAARFATVGGHYYWEKLSDARAVKAGDVPGSAYAITPAWLTAVLCSEIPGAQVLTCRVTGGSSGTSERRGLALELNDAARAGGVPHYLFTKSTTSWQQRMMLGLVGIIDGEIGFYPQIRPQVDIEAPRGYHTCLDRRSWRSMILMEDLVQSKGATFISTETVVTKEMMQDLLSNMAVWHGRFWNSPQFSAALRWLRTPADWLDAVNRFIAHRDRCRMGVSLAEAVIPAAMHGQTDTLFDAMLACLDANRRQPPTLLHGDPHIGQTYITREGRMGYGDWQIVMRGGWAYDYSYALTSALTVENRRLWEQDLLRFYLDRLQAAGALAPTFDEAWLAYRQNALYGYFCWLSTIPGSAKGNTPDMQPRHVSLDIIHRSANAIRDLESLQAMRG
jgi:Phosphotransferase enzyme family